MVNEKDEKEEQGSVKSVDRLAALITNEFRLLTASLDDFEACMRTAFGQLDNSIDGFGRSVDRMEHRFDMIDTGDA
jgi:hypothetical protein